MPKLIVNFKESIDLTACYSALSKETTDFKLQSVIAPETNELQGILVIKKPQEQPAEKSDNAPQFLITKQGIYQSLKVDSLFDSDFLQSFLKKYYHQFLGKRKIYPSLLPFLGFGNNQPLDTQFLSDLSQQGYQIDVSPDGFKVLRDGIVLLVAFRSQKGVTVQITPNTNKGEIQSVDKYFEQLQPKLEALFKVINFFQSRRKASQAQRERANSMASAAKLPTLKITADHRMFNPFRYIRDIEILNTTQENKANGSVEFKNDQGATLISVDSTSIQAPIHGDDAIMTQRVNAFVRAIKQLMKKHNVIIAYEIDCPDESILFQATKKLLAEGIPIKIANPERERHIFNQLNKSERENYMICLEKVAKQLESPGLRP